MRTLHTLHSLAAGIIMAAAVSHAHAQGSNPAPNDPWYARYQADLANCETLATPDAKANCRQDAGAAYETARKGELHSSGTSELNQNALQRCQNLPSHLRDECLANMQQGANTQTYGSVSGGGILRRTEIPIPAEPVPMPGQTQIITPQTADPALGDLPRTGKVMP